MLNENMEMDISDLSVSIEVAKQGQSVDIYNKVTDDHKK